MVLPTTTFASALFDTSSLGAAGAACCLSTILRASGPRRSIPGARLAPVPTRRCWTTCTPTSQLRARGWLATSKNGTAVYAFGNPSKDIAGVGRPGGKDRTAAQRSRTSIRKSASHRTGRRPSSRQGLNLWIHDLQRGTHSPLTSGNDSNILPAWSRDGRRILFASNRGGDWDIYSQPADGSGSAEVLLKRPFDQFPYMVAADGTLVFTEIEPTTGRDLWTLSPDGKASPLRVTRFNEIAAQFSPAERRAALDRVCVRRVRAKRDLRAVVPW